MEALLLQAVYSIPSESRLVEAIRYNLLYRWFLDLRLAEDAWTQEAFSMNRQRFELHDLYRKFFGRVVAEALEQKLASPDHSSIDGTLIRSLASQKSLAPIDAAASREKHDDDRDPGAGSGVLEQAPQPPATARPCPQLIPTTAVRSCDDQLSRRPVLRLRPSGHHGCRLRVGAFSRQRAPSPDPFGRHRRHGRRPDPTGGRGPARPLPRSVRHD